MGNYAKLSPPLMLLSLLCVLSAGAAQAQNMEQMLDSIDPNAASKLAPVPLSIQNNQPALVMPQGHNNIVPQRTMAPQGGRAQLMRNMFGGGAPQMQAPMAPQAAPKKFGMFQALFGDGAGGGDTTSSASGNMHRAESQANYAREACSRSYYGDHWTRSQAADDAYYAAEEARYEADAAGSKVGTTGADPNNAQYASTARAYAERAQAAADTARANADRVWK